jgi:SET domain-containing protein
VKPILLHKELYIKKSPIHGYGVFAGEDIAEGDIIEEAYTLMIQSDFDDLRDYCFSHAKGSKEWELPLGYGGIYNHSSDPNASHEFSAETHLMTFKARRKIKRGEEIYISYGPEWFSSRYLLHKEPSWRFKLRRYLPSTWLIARFTIVLGVLFVLLKWAS